MYSIYSLNNANEKAEIKAERFLKEGLVKVSSKSEFESIYTLKDLRNDLEQAFKDNNYPTSLNIHQIKNKKIQKFFIEYLSNTNIKNLFQALSEKGGGEVTIFPLIHVMRNYFSGPQCGLDGWHNDSGNEYNYEYCKSRMDSGNYIFGKLSISLQNNDSYGGNIDVAKATYKSDSLRSIRQRASIKLSDFFLKFLKFKTSPSIPFGLRDQWFTDLLYFFTNPKSLNPNPLDIIAFEHRLYHRGTPLSPNAWKNCLEKYPLLKIDTFKFSNNFDLEEKNKYMIYIPFGNYVGLQSYLFDRSKKDSWQKERREWFAQYEESDVFKKGFFSSNVLFNQTLTSLDLN